MALEVLGLIPARGGSKGVPRKNIHPLAGKPLIAYSIQAAKETTSITRVIVSTDDEEVAAVARGYGAEVPFIRPAELAQDDTLDLPVFQHALGWLKEHENYVPDIVVHLRPTSPLRRPEDIDRGVELLRQHPEADSVRSVCPPSQSPFKMWRLNGTYLTPLLDIDIPEPYNMPRQRLPKAYWQNGYVDAAWYRTIMKKHSMTGTKILPLILDPQNIIDVDSLWSFQLAELILSQRA